MTDAELHHTPPKRLARVGRHDPAAIEKIRALAAQGVESKQLARRFGMSPGNISKIVNRKGCWR